MGHELAPVRVLLDKTHPHLQTSRDQTGYVLGEIGVHNVVVAVMPEVGNNCAARTAKQLLCDFPSVRLGLLVGIGGGVPDKESGNDIRLGDIVVSKPTGGLSGVVQYDRGKSTIHGFEQTITLPKPPDVLLRAVEMLVSKHKEDKSQVPQYLHEMLERRPTMRGEYGYPGAEHDQLFQATYNHPTTDHDQLLETTSTHHTHQDCGGCDRSQVIVREERSCQDPQIHYGIIGSANIVLKNAAEREVLRKRLKIICVEMEAAGFMETFPCLVIRGICDYADSHKNKKWQGYAAAAAAAYMKELLMTIPRQEVEKQVKLVDVVEVSQISDLIKLGDDISENIRMKEHSKVMHWLSSANFWGKQADLFGRAQTGTGEWIFEDKTFKSWLTGPAKALWCRGDAGAGKTTLSAIIINRLTSTMKSKDIGIAWLYIDYREHDLQTMENLFTNILVQLFKQRGEISKSMMKSLGFNWEGAKPSLSEYKSWLQEERQKFDRMIVIIDALDELRTKELGRQLINELQSLSPPIHLLVTSRPHRELLLLQGDSVEIEIQPRKDDVILYVESRLQNNPRLLDHILEDRSLKELTIEMLTKANDRM
jgi:nucleoside phosphorylase